MLEVNIKNKANFLWSQNVLWKREAASQENYSSPTVAVQPRAEADRQDRGWAWVVFVSVFIGRMIFLGTLLNFNMYYTVFLTSFNCSHALAALIGSTLWASYDFTAIVSGLVVNWIGPRKTTIVGALMMGTSMALSSFATNVYYLIFSMGFIVGLGTQFISIGCVQGLRTYFRRYQNLVVGVSTAGSGIGMLIFGKTLPFILDVYGWRGTMAIHGAVIFNVCIVGSVMFPVASPKEAPVKNETCSECEQKSSSTCLPRMDGQFLSLLLSVFFFGFSFVIMTVLFNDIINTKGLGKYLSLAHSLFAVGDILGRVTSGVSSGLHVSPLLLFMVIHFFHAVIQFVFTIITVKWELYLCSLLYGISSGCANGLFFIVPCDLYKTSDFLRHFPYISMVAGMGSMVGTPIAGYMTDVTGSYTAALLLGGSAALIAAVVLLPLILKRQNQTEECTKL